MNRRQVLSFASLAGGAAAVLPVGVAGAAPARHPQPVRAKDGTRLFVRDWGEGPVVLFTASWALNSEMWAYQVAHLSERGFRCVAFDRRGHGRSDAPAAGYDMDTFADDLAAVIGALDLRDIVLVGHSLGCSEILRYVGRHGTDRVRKVALVAPASPYLVQTPDNPYGAPMAYFEETMAQWSRDFPKWIEDNRAPFFTPRTSPGMQGWLVDMMLETPVPVARATMRANLTDRRPDLARLDRPTLILHGTQDASAPLEITGARIAAAVPQAELKVYEGAPHGLFVTHMDQVNRDLEAFIRA